jgi:peroxiredoxin
MSSQLESTPRIARVVSRAMVFALCATACSRDTERTGAPSSTAVAWGEATSLTQTMGGGAAPVFATSPSQQVTLAWVSAPNGGTDGRLYVRPNANATAVSELRDAAGSMTIYGEVPPKIAYAPDGMLHAAYLVTKVVPGEKWPQNLLRFASSKDNGATWDRPTTVVGDGMFGSYSDHALHIASNGTVYLSWLSVVGNDSSRTFVARSSDGGHSWTKPVVVDLDPSCPCCRTAMASGPDGALYVAWRKRFPSAGGEVRDIVLARSTDGGATWSTPARVHADAWKVDHCPDAGPSVRVARDGVVHVAWWTGKDGAAGVRYVQSLDGGRTFSEPVLLGVAAQSRPAHVQLALGDASHAGVIAAAWDDGTMAVPRIVVRLSRDNGKTFGPAEPVSAAGDQAGYPVVNLRGDTVMVAWQARSLAEASADSAQHAAMVAHDPNDAGAYINRVGAMQVMTRRGVIGASPAAVASDAAFRPLSVGDNVPRYATRSLAGDAIQIGGNGPVTVLNVWATWCTSCREEMEDLNALHRELSARGVRVIGVSVDGGDGTRVRRFAETERLAFTVAHDPEQLVQQLYQVAGVPETFVIGADGKLLWRHVGTLHPVVDSVRALTAR